MPENILVRASIGLYVDQNNKYYLQVIFADTEVHHVISIDRELAKEISESEDLDIWPMPEIKLL